MGAGEQKLSSMEKQNMIRAFKMFDVSGDGKIQPEEFKSALVAQGIDVQSEIYDLAFYLIDADENGYIDSKEFNRFFMDFALAGSDADFYDIIGCAADLNGDSVISLRELKRFYDFKHVQMSAEDQAKFGKEMSKAKFVEYVRNRFEIQ